MNLFEILIITENSDPKNTEYKITEFFQKSPDPDKKIVDITVVPPVADTNFLISTVKKLSGKSKPIEVEFIMNMALWNINQRDLKIYLEVVTYIQKLITDTIKHEDFILNCKSKSDPQYTEFSSMFAALSPIIGANINKLIIQGKDCAKIHETIFYYLEKCIVAIKKEENYEVTNDAVFSLKIINDDFICMKIMDGGRLISNNTKFNRFDKIKQLNVDDAHFKRYITMLNDVIKANCNIK